MLVLELKFQPNVTTDCRGIRRSLEVSRGIIEHLCSVSGARLNDQGWRQVVLSKYLQAKYNLAYLETRGQNCSR